MQRNKLPYELIVSNMHTVNIVAYTQDAHHKALNYSSDVYSRTCPLMIVIKHPTFNKNNSKDVTRTDIITNNITALITNNKYINK